MKNKLKIASAAGTFILVSVLYMTPTNARQKSDDYKSFSNCWGSGNFAKSCTNGSATVYGCQPETDSYCMGKKEAQ